MSKRGGSGGYFGSGKRATIKSPAGSTTSKNAKMSGKRSMKGNYPMSGGKRTM